MRAQRIIVPFHFGDFSTVVGRHIDQELVAFVVPDMEQDIPAGIYPTFALAERHPNPFVKQFDQTVKEYLGLIRDHRKRASSSAVDMQAFMRLVVVPERPEFRLGYTRRGHRGSPVGQGDLRLYLQRVLYRYPALLSVMARKPDAMHLTPRMDMDRVSDFFLSIGLRDLIELTQYYAAFEKFSKACMKLVRFRDVWNKATQEFDPFFDAVVPVDEHGRPILLIDKLVVRGTPPMTATDYLEYGVADAAFAGRKSLKKEELLARIGEDEAKIEQFVTERLIGIQPHTRFQMGKIQRRKRP